MGRVVLQHSAAEYLPARITLPQLREAARGCRGCDLYRHATQTVFGEGVRAAELMVMGEQPGDEEDLAGRPFVGPAGRLLDKVLGELEIDRTRVYVTNAVKHFKWRPGTGARKRMHDKPNVREVLACHPWLEAEIQAVRPQLVVALGATAAGALLGSKFRLTRQRGEVVASAWAGPVLATYHPSAILRAPDHNARERMREEFTADIRKASQSLSKT